MNINKDDIEFIQIWKVTYKPENVPLWQGAQAAMDKIYYFDKKESMDGFIDNFRTKHPDYAYMMRSTKTIAIKYDGKFYPFGESYMLSME